MAGLSTMLIKVVADITDAKGKMAALNTSIAGVGTSITNMGAKTQSAAEIIGTRMSAAGKVFTQVGGALTMGLTLPIIALGGAAIKTAIDFETAFTGVKKTIDEGANGVNGAVTSFAGLEQGIIDISTQLGVSKGDIASIMQMAGQLGIRGNEALLKFTETVAKLNITTGQSPEFLSSMIGKLAAISGLDVAKDIEKLGGVITALGNSTATTEKDIIRFGVRAAAAGRILGMTLPDILAISAAFESTGTKAERGGTAFTKILLAIQAEAAGAKEVTGKYTEEIKKNNEELATWKSKLEDAQDAQKGLTASSPADEVQRITSELSTAQEMVDLYIEAQGDMNTVMSTASNKAGGFAKLLGMTNEAFSTLVKSEGGGTKVFEMFINQIGNMTNAGAAVQTVMKDLGLSDARLVQAVMSLSQANVDTMVTTSDLTSALATARAAWAESTGDFSNAMDREVIKKLNTVASQWNIFKELIQETFLIFTKQGMGGIQNFMKGINTWLVDFNEKLKGMSDKEVKKVVDNLIKLALLGPALIIVGKALGTIGWTMMNWSKILPVLLKIAGWGKAFIETISLLGIALMKVFGVVGVGAVAGFAVAIGVVIAAIALVAAGVAAFKYAMSPAIEKVDLFGKGISDLTKSKVEPFLKSMEAVDTFLMKQEWANRIITPADVSSLQSRLKTISESILNELDADKNASLAKLAPLKYMMDPKMYEEVIAGSTKYYDDLKKEVQAGEAKIMEILTKASKEKRDLTAKDRFDIEAIQLRQKEIAIQLMAETEEETNIIMGRLKDKSVKISLEQMAGIIGNAGKTRDEVVKAAEDQAYGIIEQAAKMRDAGAITQSAYIAVVESATKTKLDTIDAANAQYQGIYDAASAKLPQIETLIDESNGKVRSKWDVFWLQAGKGWDDFWVGTKDKTSTGTNGILVQYEQWSQTVEKDWTTWTGNLGTNWDSFWRDLGPNSKKETDKLSTQFLTWEDTTVADFQKWWAKIELGWSTMNTNIGIEWNKFWGGIGTWLNEKVTEWKGYFTEFGIQAGKVPGILKGKFDEFATWFGNLFKAPVNMLIEGLNTLIKGLNSIKITAPDWLKYLGLGNIAGKTFSFNLQPITKLAKGGMPNSGQAFLAGEDGPELMGKHRGKTTVMPLENTSFVSAIGRAVMDGVVAGLSQSQLDMSKLMKFPSMDSVATYGDGSTTQDNMVTTMVEAMKKAGVGAAMIDGKLVTDNVSGHMYTTTKRGKY